MASVRMLVDISGGRADGTEWPRYGTVLECGDSEAERLVAGGHAEWDDTAAEEPAPEPLAEPEPPAAEPEPVPAVDEPPEPENGSQDDEDGSDTSKPRVRDPKEAWEQHAMTVHGVDINVARSMSKKDLIDNYGKSA